MKKLTKELTGSPVTFNVTPFDGGLKPAWSRASLVGIVLHFDPFRVSLGAHVPPNALSLIGSIPFRRTVFQRREAGPLFGSSRLGSMGKPMGLLFHLSVCNGRTGGTLALRWANTQPSVPAKAGVAGSLVSGKIPCMNQVRGTTRGTVQTRKQGRIPSPHWDAKFAGQLILSCRQCTTNREPASREGQIEHRHEQAVMASPLGRGISLCPSENNPIGGRVPLCEICIARGYSI